MASDPHDDAIARGTPLSEHAFEGSTTWELRKVKITRAPQASARGRRSRSYFRRLPVWNLRKPLSVTIKYRGGAEAWVEIHARGGIYRCPGYVPIYEVLAELTNNR